jgi:glycosyltransferase involved in cell wall biosynthesis
MTNFHFLSSYGLLSLLIPAKNLTLNTWGSDVNLLYKSNNKFKKWLVKLALKRFVWINAPALHMKEKLISLGAPAENIHVYQYGVNYSKLNGMIKNKNKNITIISNRNWQTLYCIDTIVLGFVQWQLTSNIIAELHIYGGGSLADTKRIAQLVDDAPPVISSRILVKGIFDKNTMLENMSSANLFVSIPIRDGTPLSLLEAMVLGLYPVVSDIDANKEWLSNDCSEFVKKPGAHSLSTAFENACMKLNHNDLWRKSNNEKVKEMSDYNTNIIKFQNEMFDFLEIKS